MGIEPAASLVSKNEFTIRYVTAEPPSLTKEISYTVPDRKSKPYDEEKLNENEWKTLISSTMGKVNGGNVKRKKRTDFIEKLAYYWIFDS